MEPTIEEPTVRHPAPKLVPRAPDIPKQERGARLPAARALKQADHARQRMFVSIPAGTLSTDILKPDYWAHHTASVRPNDLIEAPCEDGSWDALLRVMFVGRAEVRVSVIYCVEHDEVEGIESDIFEVKWKGPGVQFAVVRRDDGAVIKNNLYPKDVAITYLRNHLRGLKR